MSPHKSGQIFWQKLIIDKADKYFTSWLKKKKYTYTSISAENLGRLAAFHRSTLSFVSDCLRDMTRSFF